MTARRDMGPDAVVAPRLDAHARAALAMAGTPDRRRLVADDATIRPGEAVRSGENYATTLLREHREAMAGMTIVVTTRRPER